MMFNFKKKQPGIKKIYMKYGEIIFNNKVND